MQKDTHSPTPTQREISRLAEAVHLLIRALLVAGKGGAPAEGKIPFNPLYFHILSILHAEPDTRPSKLADQLGVPRTTLSTASKALKNRGLIVQAADSTDGRAQVLRLSPEGVAVAEAIRRQDHKNMALLLTLVEPRHRAVVINVLEEVSQLLATDAP